MNIQTLRTIFCPKCWWVGNDYDCGRLTVIEMQAIGVADEKGFLLPRFKSWDLRYCPKCLYTKLTLIHQKEYENLVSNNDISLDEDTQKYLNREKK